MKVESAVPASRQEPANQSGTSGAASPATESPAADPSAVSAKLLRYAQRIIDRYDRNGNGKLEKDEWQAMRGNPQQADRDGDGILDRDEWIRYLAEYGRERRIRLLPPQPGDLPELPPLLNPITAGEEEKPAEETHESPKGSANEPNAVAEAGKSETVREDVRRRDTKFYAPASRLAGAPAAFLSRDRDGDGQLSVSEFAPNKDRTSLEEFARYDRNRDGVITVQEYLGPSSSPAAKSEEPKKQE